VTPARFHAIREQLGLTQAELARACEVSLRSIAYYEAGERPIRGPIVPLLEWLATGVMPDCYKSP